MSSEPAKTSIPPKAIFLLVMIMFAFGSGWPIMKYGVIELPILTFRWLTAILSGVGVLALAACLGQRLRLYREEIAIAFWCGLFNVTGWFYFSGLGLTMLSAGRSTILAYTHPLFAFLIALAMGHDKLAPRRLFGLFCGMCAVVALSAKDFAAFGQNPMASSRCSRQPRVLQPAPISRNASGARRRWSSPAGSCCSAVCPCSPWR